MTPPVSYMGPPAVTYPPRGVKGVGGMGSGRAGQSAGTRTTTVAEPDGLVEFSGPNQSRVTSLRLDILSVTIQPEDVDDAEIDLSALSLKELVEYLQSKPDISTAEYALLRQRFHSASADDKKAVIGKVRALTLKAARQKTNETIIISFTAQQLRVQGRDERFRPGGLSATFVARAARTVADADQAMQCNRDILAMIEYLAANAESSESDPEQAELRQQRTALQTQTAQVAIDIGILLAENTELLQNAAIAASWASICAVYGEIFQTSLEDAVGIKSAESAPESAARFSTSFSDFGVSSLSEDSAINALIMQLLQAKEEIRDEIEKLLDKMRTEKKLQEKLALKKKLKKKLEECKAQLKKLQAAMDELMVRVAQLKSQAHQLSAAEFSAALKGMDDEKKDMLIKLKTLTAEIKALVTSVGLIDTSTVSDQVTSSLV